MFEPPLLPLLDDDDARATAAAHGMPEAFASVNLFRTTLHHVPIARRAGMTDDEIIAVRTSDASRLTPLDLVAIQVVDEALDHVGVSEATLVEARSLVGDDRALLELLMIPAATARSARCC